MALDELVARIASIAVTQHGLVRTDQVAPGERVGVRHLARRGHLVRVAKGVYGIAGAPVTWEQRLTAAAWALGRDAVVSHMSAARLWGYEHFADDALEVPVPRRQRGRAVDGLGVTVHSALRLPRGDVRSHSGLRVTSPERTIVDLARAGTAERRLEAAVDSALRLRLTTLERIVDRVSAERGPARWGVGRLDLVLLDAGGHTTLERLFLRLVREAGLPLPVPQVVHRHCGRHVARVDFLFADHDLVVEVSGGARSLVGEGAGQGRSPAQRAAASREDRARVHLRAGHASARPGHRHAPSSWAVSRFCASQPQNRDRARFGGEGGYFRKRLVVLSARILPLVWQVGQ